MLPYETVKREVLVKKKSKTSQNFGCYPESRSAEDLITYGIINVDKPKGPTSHHVSAYVQQILGITKSGHSGTLDPKVTGVLPIALGRGTRIVQGLLNQGKEYVCVMHLHKSIEHVIIRNSVKHLLGKIIQLPPKKSAVKRVEREREIYHLDILEIKDNDVLFIVGCQAGTYIRKYCHDWGRLLSCGAHMAELRRTKAAGFCEIDSKTLLDVQDAFWFYKNEGNEKYLRDVILPVEEAVATIPKVWVFDSSVETLCHGMNLNAPGVSLLDSGIETGDTVAVMTLKNELVGLGVAALNSEQILHTDRGICVKMNKIFMQFGTYPRIYKDEEN